MEESDTNNRMFSREAESQSLREQRYIRSGRMNFVENPNIAFYGQGRVENFHGAMFCHDARMAEMQSQFGQNWQNLSSCSQSLLSSPSSSTSSLKSPDHEHFKRPISKMGLEEFDYEASRPQKKFVCEDKVIEIFDRLHIREGENYIVEDVDDLKARRTASTDPEHNVSIEEIPDGEASQHFSVQFSPELKNVLNSPQSSSSCTVTDRLIQSTRDSITKAVILWQPPLLQQAAQRVNDPESESEEDDEGTTPDKKSSVQIEEITFQDDCSGMDLDIDDSLDCEEEMEL